MPGVAVKLLDSAGGPQLAGGQSWFKVQSQPVVLLGDPVTPHGIGLHAGPTMVQASSWFKIGGIGVCRQGDLASCGDASTGRPWFVVA